MFLWILAFNHPNTTITRIRHGSMTPKSEMTKDQHGNQMPQMGSAILDTYLQFITENAYGN